MMTFPKTWLCENSVSVRKQCFLEKPQPVFTFIDSSQFSEMEMLVLR